MNRLAVILLMLFLLKISTSYGQVNVQNFGIAQGLPQSQVSCMSEDSLGYLWIGTLGGGLARFDGATFKTFTMADGLPNNFILDMHVISPDKIWVSTQKGISFFNGLHFKNFDNTEGSGLLTQRILVHGDSLIYILNNGTAGLILNDSIQGVIKNPFYKNVAKTFKTKEGTTFIFRTVDKTIELVTFQQDRVFREDVQHMFTRLYAVFTYKNTTLLSTNGGLFSYNDGALVKYSDHTFPVYGYDAVNDQFIGIHNFNLVQSGRNSVFTRNISPLKGLIFSSYLDKSGITWLGTDKGLFKIYPYNFENLLSGPERDDPVMAIQRHGEELWVGTTYQGIKVYRNNVLVKKYNFGSAKKNFISCIRKDNKGTIWIGTLGGLAYFNAGSFVWVHPEIIPSAVQFDFDASGNVVVSGENSGLYHVSATHKVKSLKEFSTILTWAIKYNKTRNIFLLGTNFGLKKLSGDRIEDITIAELTTVFISSLDWIDSETLIIGTLGKGIFLYSMRTNQVIKVIDERAGLRSNTLFFVFKDRSGIWAGTERGIDLIQYNAERNTVMSISHFGALEGLTGVEANLNSYFKDSSQLLFGLVDGLYTYKGFTKSQDFRLHLDNVKLFYNQIPENPAQHITNTTYSGKQYSFSHTENHLTFLFSKVNKKNPESVFYKYKLDGYDKIWSNPSASKTATYSNLVPGNYTFHVIATDQSGAFTWDKTLFNFQIIPAFYQTLYFKVMIGLLIAAIVFIIIYYFNRARIQRVLYIQEIKDNEKTRLRKEIARDFHDELGNQVARMINYIGLLRIRRNLEVDIYESLSEFSQHILNGTQDFVWTLDPGNDELDKIVIYLKDFGERMFSEKNIDFRFHGEVTTLIKTPVGFSRQINLIFKEAMTNAFKHSQATEVDFIARVTACEIVLTLRDNGVGMNHENENSERGIANMKIRAKRINGKIRFDSSGHGTTIDLVIPI
jgi:signal transduction histidine kinase/ligand-binding sensor domain-containing protein